MAGAGCPRGARRRPLYLWPPPAPCPALRPRFGFRERRGGHRAGLDHRDQRLAERGALRPSRQHVGVPVARGSPLRRRRDRRVPARGGERSLLRAGRPVREHRRRLASGDGMARISLTNLRHTYREPARDEADWALKRLDLNWEAGSANALLGPSGCGKTTLLNIISGLLRPTEGTVLFGERDVTALPPDARNIAQVFQFPVVYDTMSVYDNLAFPLRNRGLPQPSVDARVREIAAMLHLEPTLDQRAAGLTADGWGRPRFRSGKARLS